MPVEDAITKSLVCGDPGETNMFPLKHVKLWLWLWFVVVDDVADSVSAVSNILPDVWYANVPTFANLTKNDQTNGKMYVIQMVEYESV